MNVPPSIGEEASGPELVLHRFEVPLPKTRPEIILLIGNLLGEGGVQKITVAVGKPVEIVKIVDKNNFGEPIETPEDDLWLRARNGKMVASEFFINRDGYFHLFNAFTVLDKEQKKAKKIYCKNLKQIRTWLGLSETAPLEMLFGVEVVRHPDVPDDAVILVGTSYDDLDPEGTVGVRVPVDVITVTAKVVAIKG